MNNQELNEAVAKKLGGERRVLPDAELADGTIIKHYPDYAGSIQAAWEVWEHIIKNNPEWSIAIEHQGKEYECWMSHPTERQIIAQADTAPRAICLAFLKLP